MADVHPVLQYLIDSEFRDLEGATVEGQLCLTDEAINLGLGEVIKGLTGTGASGGGGGGSIPVSPLPDPSIFTRKIQIAKLNYRTEEGKTIIEVKTGLGK